LVPGCGDETTKVILPDPPELRATITGRVISDPDNAMVTGATYRLLGTEMGGTTDASGLYRLEGLTEGTYQMLFSAPGHASVRYAFTIQPGSDNSTRILRYRDVYLPSRTGSLKLAVVVGFTGNPAAHAKIDIVYGSSSYYQESQQIDDPDLPDSVEADAEGILQLNELPAQSIDLYVRPYDVDEDGLPDCITTHVDMTLQPHVLIATTIAIDRESDYVRIIGTNVPDYNNPTLTDPVAFFVFSREMSEDDGSTQITLAKHDYPPIDVPFTITWASPMRLEILPSVDLTDADASYELEVRVKSRNGYAFEFATSFSWLTTGGGPAGCDQVVTDLRLAASSSPIDNNTRDLAFEWSAIPCAGGYKLYAHDDRGNPDWLLLLEEPTDYDVGTIATTCSLPAQFDRYTVDGVQTPFAGISVTFCVVPRLASSPRPGIPHPTLTVNETTPPELAGFTQIGSSMNMSGQPLPLEFRLGMNEYVAVDQQAPVVEIEEAGGDPAYALDPAAASWVWDPGRRSGLFVFTVANGTDASGDRIRARFDVLADLTGNAQPGPVMTDWMTIRATETIFHFEGSGQGWTGTGQGWVWCSPDAGPGGAYDGTGCWATSNSGNYAINWDTSLTSPEIYVPNASTSVSFRLWHDIGYVTDSLTFDVLLDGEAHTHGTWLEGRSNGWAPVTISLSQYSGHLVRFRFHFVSDDRLDYRDGAFVDDVEVRTTLR
jgi:hypothetical protein